MFERELGSCNNSRTISGKFIKYHFYVNKEFFYYESNINLFFMTFEGCRMLLQFVQQRSDLSDIVMSFSNYHLFPFFLFISRIALI